MYALQGIERKDKAARAAAMAENWRFFGAPVGIIVSIDRVCDRNSWGHVGCMLQTICENYAFREYPSYALLLLFLALRLRSRIKRRLWPCEPQILSIIYSTG